MTTTKTRNPSLDEVAAKVADIGYPMTDREREIAARRLAKSGTYLGRPDPLAGTEPDPITAVEHIFEERGGPLARHIDGPPSLYALFGRDEPTAAGATEPDALAEENARLREELERYRATAGPLPGEAAVAASTGPIDRDKAGEEQPTPAATINAQAETGSVTPDALDNPTGTTKPPEKGGRR